MKHIETLRKLIPLADAHQAADEYESGHYEWRPGACSVGCSTRDLGLASNDHAGLAKVLGVPVGWMQLQDYYFERLPPAARRPWTPKVFRAILAGHERGVEFARSLMTHASLCLGRCASRIGVGDEPWRQECRAIVAMARDATASGRWLTDEEAATRAPWETTASARPAAWPEWATRMALAVAAPEVHRATWAVLATWAVWTRATSWTAEEAWAVEVSTGSADMLRLLAGEVS